MQLVFDTFKRVDPVTFYKSASQEIVVTDDNYNADFDNPYVSGIVESGQSGSYECRIIWPREQDLAKYFQGDEELYVKAAMPKGLVKLQMESGAFSFFDDTKAFFIGSDKYVPFSTPRKLGIFGEYQFFEVMAIRET